MTKNEITAAVGKALLDLAHAQSNQQIAVAVEKLVTKLGGATPAEKGK